MEKKLLYRSTVILVFLIFLTQFSFSQTNFRVTGKVTDQAGKPLEGATVTVKGTTTSTISGIDGNFEINAPSSDATLIISYVGFTNKEVALNGKSTVSVNLIAESSSLDE